MQPAYVLKVYKTEFRVVANFLTRAFDISNKPLFGLTAS